MEDATFDRIITQDDARIYHAEGFLLNVLGMNYTNPVPLFDSSFKRIGDATLTSTYENLREVKLFMDYHCPERLEIETGQGISLATVCDPTGKELTAIVLLLSKQRPVTSDER
jgi:hypothetical protein